MDKKHHVNQLEYQFKQANYNCVGITGDKSQDQRNYAIEKFSKGEIPILIGTDVVGRGLDLPDVKYVINYDSPKNLEDYIHRIGRTGRCGKTGTSFSLINYDNIPLIKPLISFLKTQKCTIPEFFYEMIGKNQGSISKPSYNKSYGGFDKGFKSNNNKFGSGNSFSNPNSNNYGGYNNVKPQYQSKYSNQNSNSGNNQNFGNGFSSNQFGKSYPTNTNGFGQNNSSYNSSNFDKGFGYKTNNVNDINANNKW
jgi:ATP-dependent RNA helicase DDX3X